jgi:hypothetical protein
VIRGKENRMRRTESCDVTTTQGGAAFRAKQAQPPKVVRLAEGELLAAAVGRFDGEELVGDDLAAVL